MEYERFKLYKLLHTEWILRNNLLQPEQNKTLLRMAKKKLNIRDDHQPLSAIVIRLKDLLITQTALRKQLMPEKDVLFKEYLEQLRDDC